MNSIFTSKKMCIRDRIISGAYQKDAGTYEFDGEQFDNVTPQFTLEKGISVIYQELSYLPTMTIAENIFLARQPKTCLLYTSRCV